MNKVREAVSEYVRNVMEDIMLFIVRKEYLKPSFLIIGAQKAGTTSLFHCLAQHPSIRAPKVKEICFFDGYKNYQKGYYWYHRNFPVRDKKEDRMVTFEASIAYLRDNKSPGRIYDYNPEMKLIVVLRDPVDRAFSQWNMGRNFVGHKKFPMLGEERKFDEIVKKEIKMINILKELGYSMWCGKYLTMGLYLEQIQNYLRYFRREQIFIAESEIMKRDRVKVLNDILEFLGLPPHEWDEAQLADQFIGDYKQRQMDEDTLRALADFYRPFNEELFDFLGKRYDWK